MVFWGQKWLYSIRSGCFWAKVVVYKHSIVILAEVVDSGESDCIWAKVVVFGQKWLNSCKVVVFGQKWLYSSKVVVFRQKLL